MLRDLIKEGGLYTLVNFLTKGVSLLLLPFYTSYFLPEDYGVIEMFTIFGYFITGIFTLQLNQGLARYVTEPTFKRIDKIEYASTAVWLSALSLLISFAVLGLTAPLFIDFFFDSEMVSVRLYVTAIASILVNAVFFFLGVYFRFLRETTIFSVMSFIHALLGILLTWMFVAVFEMGIESIYISYLIITPVLILIQLYLLGYRLKFKIFKNKVSDLIKFSLPMIPLTVATSLMVISDRIFIKYYEDLAQLGIYGIGAKFATIISITVGGFSMAIIPLVLEKHLNEQTKTELKKIFYLFFSVGTFGLLTLSLFAKETIILITNEKYLEAHTVMPYLYCSALFIGLQMFSHGLFIKKKTGQMAIITMIFASVNIGLNFLLIPDMGIVGAAVATLIATIGQQITLFIFSQRHFKVNIHYPKIIVLTVLSFGIIMFFAYFEFTDYWISVLSRILSISLFLVILNLTGVLDFKRLKKFLLKKLNRSKIA